MTTPTPVFSNPDGTDYPEMPVAWSVQGTAAYPGPATKVFAGQGTQGTPANTFGWTVQSVGTYAS